jgi:hypothetical protein
VTLSTFHFFANCLQLIVLFGFFEKSIMQNSVANILKIIKEFILEARAEKALTVANIILLLISGSKISLYQLGLKTTKSNIRLKSKEQKIRRILDKLPITSKIYAKAVFSLFFINSNVELIIDRTNWKFGQTFLSSLPPLSVYHIYEYSFCSLTKFSSSPLHKAAVGT